MVWFAFKSIWNRSMPAKVEVSGHDRPFTSFVWDYALPTGVVLLLLLCWMKSQAVNLSQHNRYVEAGRQLLELDARVNQDLLQLRLGLLDYYDPIVARQAQIRELQRVLEWPPGFTGSLRQTSIEQVQENIQLWQEKDELIEQFKSKHAVLQNSLAYFPIAVTDLAAQPDLDSVFAENLNDLLENILRFNLSTQEKLVRAIRANMEQLQGQVELGGADLANLLAHANIILKHRPETDELIEEILTSPTSDRVMELAKTYETSYRQAVRSASLYRWGFYILSTLLVIAIAASIISKLRTTATALEQSKTRLRHLFDNTQVGIFRTRSSDGSIVEANQYFASMLGYCERDSMVDVKQADHFYVHPQIRQQILEIVRRTGEIHNFETQFRRRDGSVCWVLLSCRLNRAENCLDEVVADISDRVAAEAALRQSEATQKALFQAIPDFMLRMSRHNYVFDFVSPGKNDILSNSNLEKALETANLQKVDVREVLPPDLVRQRLEAVDRALESRDLQIYEQCLERFGQSAWEEVRVVPCGADDVLVMIRDISDRKQAEADLQQATKEAQVANQAKSQFLSNMSHELRTPLNVILGFTQLLTRNRDLNSQQQSYLKSIDQSSKHLLSLINDILEISKIEAGKVSLNLGDFDLYGLLDGIHLMFQYKANSKAVELQLQRSPNLPQYIRTDESKLRQILVNLVGNAVKFTPSGCIYLRASVLGQEPIADSESRLELQFEVEDTGLGIEPADVEVLFEPFVQARNNSSCEGTGLGLPISQKFVELMGGEIAVSSQVGRGSLFRFSIGADTVPCNRIATCRENRPVVGLEPGQPEYRILIVEDIPESRQLLVDLLEPIGFQLREAQNGSEAIDICQEWQPHLIWMDIRMPVTNGYEATERIKSFPGEAPVIIALTSSAFKQEQTLAIKTGFDDFICKPFRTEILFEKMAEFLDVRYVYGDAVASEASPKENRAISATDFQPISATDLRVMPTDWIEALHQAATKVNGKEANRLIREIPSERGNLANHLTQLVENFSFEAIVALTQER